MLQVIYRDEKGSLDDMRHTPQRVHAPGWTPAMPDDTTIANDTTTTLPPSLPPSYQPGSVRAPRGKPPRWPMPGKSSSKTSGRPRGSRYSRNPYTRNKASAYAPTPVKKLPHAAYVAPAAPRDRRVYDAVRRRLPRFHPIHLVLLAGVGAMWLAITQPWGSDAGGAPIYIQQFSIPRISDPSVNIGQLALQTASNLAMVAVVLAVALLLINILYTLMRRLRLSTLGAILFIPLLALMALLLLADLTLAAGFGGLGFLSQLPFVRDHGFASIGVAQAAIGFYLWWIGIGATLIGALGEIFIDRR